jgi:TM2 domain-containing membrane protein YozV|nr:MAG TPA: putative membrane protein [Caudoviricetes sp.]
MEKAGNNYIAGRAPETGVIVGSSFVQGTLKVAFDSGGVQFVQVGPKRVKDFELEDRVIVYFSDEGDHVVLDNNRNGGAYNAIGQKRVNKVVYVLLALFLGGLGAHKFYSGKTGLGILYLVFCWTLIPGLIAFVEAIVVACKKSDRNGEVIL